MKIKNLIILLTFFSGLLYSQAPQGFNYQSVVRDNLGALVTNTTVGIQFQIRQNSATGSIIYTETHSPTTNAYGVFNLVVGQGTTSDTFSSINWGSGSYFLEVGIDTSGGTSYTSIGTSQFLSVPYAAHATTSADTPNNTSDLVNNSGFISSGNSSNMQPYTGINYIISLQGVFPSPNRSANTENVGRGIQPYLGEIILFPGNFAPAGWALCNGQILPINSNQALFSIIGTTYGGDGETTFALPDLRGRVALHPGTGPGLSPRALGEKSGSETVD